MSWNEARPQDNASSKQVLTLRKPNRREVVAVVCAGGLWKLLGLLALRPELVAAVTTAAVLLVLFVDLDPLPRFGESRLLPPPRNAADEDPSVNPLAHLPNRKG
ncbi:hypothetical protein ACJ6WF_47465 [Streptomyces sp. MMS24-I2-30]|uniref:hypothetical protein n=1 Tax=Streptomyces sp. MMS24-I2-30 TaxID=3351564 RepID=UPI003896A540